jgi:hypothetical protein
MVLHRESVSNKFLWKTAFTINYQECGILKYSLKKSKIRVKTSKDVPPSEAPLQRTNVTTTIPIPNEMSLHRPEMGPEYPIPNQKEAQLHNIPERDNIGTF